MNKILLGMGVGVMAFFMLTSNCTVDNDAAVSNIKDANVASVAKASGGIKFDHMSLEDAMKEAKESGKPIFIDCYTSWCGPCKQMAATTFKEDEVGEFFNENFINLKIDIEKDADGPNVARAYQIRVYPTLLIIDGDGNLVSQTLGLQTKSQLLAFGKGAL